MLTFLFLLGNYTGIIMHSDKNTFFCNLLLQCNTYEKMHGTCEQKEWFALFQCTH